MLDSLVLAAILSLAPTVEPAHAVELSRAIAGAVEHQAELAAWLPGAAAPLPDTPERTALALVEIAHHESGFRREVSDCRVVGARGDITAFQLLGWWARGGHTRGELCASPRLAARAALVVLATHARRCGSMAAAFRGYASGDCGRRTRAGRELLEGWWGLVGRIDTWRGAW